MVVLERSVVEKYRSFTLYNSPYTAHDKGCAVDLYPYPKDKQSQGLDEPRITSAPSPVSGKVVKTLETRAPSKPYAAENDYLIVIDTDDLFARILHVEPPISEGDYVEIGDQLGKMVRSGYFAPWVGNHMHLGFRPKDSDPVRASGSLRLELGFELDSLEWSGNGTVTRTGETYAILDKPRKDTTSFAGIEAGLDLGNASKVSKGVIDGGMPHYDRGGVFTPQNRGSKDFQTVSVAGFCVGVARGRDLRWGKIDVYANDKKIRGISFYFSQEPFGVKLICPKTDFEVGENVSISIR